MRVQVRFLILSVFLLGHAAGAKTLVDGSTCEAKLAPRLLQDLIAKMPPRQSLEGVGSFVPDAEEPKLIDVRGQDEHKVAASVIRRLHIEDVEHENPHLAEVIEASAHIAHERHALFSVSHERALDSSPMLRISLDMVNDQPVIRVPSLHIENGKPVPRVDIVVKSGKVSLLTATAGSLESDGNVVVGDSTNHGLGVEIDARDERHPVIDAASARPQWFIGAQAQPQLCSLLAIADEIVHFLFPHAEDVSFRAKGVTQNFTPEMCH